MRQMLIKLNNADQIRKFVNTVDRFDVNFELGSKGRVVNPKSILGVFTLDLSCPQKLRCDSDDLKIVDKLKPFICKSTV